MLTFLGIFIIVKISINYWFSDTRHSFPVISYIGNCNIIVQHGLSYYTYTRVKDNAPEINIARWHRKRACANSNNTTSSRVLYSITEPQLTRSLRRSRFAKHLISAESRAEYLGFIRSCGVRSQPRNFYRLHSDAEEKAHATHVYVSRIAKGSLGASMPINQIGKEKEWERERERETMISDNTYRSRKTGASR